MCRWIRDSYNNKRLIASPFNISLRIAVPPLPLSCPSDQWTPRDPHFSPPQQLRPRLRLIAQQHSRTVINLRDHAAPLSLATFSIAPHFAMLSMPHRMFGTMPAVIPRVPLTVARPCSFRGASGRGRRWMSSTQPRTKRPKTAIFFPGKLLASQFIAHTHDSQVRASNVLAWPRPGSPHSRKPSVPSSTKSMPRLTRPSRASSRAAPMPSST